MKQAILLDAGDVAALKRGGGISFTVGSETVTLMFARAAAATNGGPPPRTRSAMTPKWRAAIAAGLRRRRDETQAAAAPKKPHHTQIKWGSPAQRAAVAKALKTRWRKSS